LRAVRSAYSTCRLRLPFLLRSRPLSSSSSICFERQSAAGGMFRPSHIGAVKIAGIHRISVILFERLKARVLPAPVSPPACFLLARGTPGQGRARRERIVSFAGQPELRSCDRARSPISHTAWRIRATNGLRVRFAVTRCWSGGDSKRRSHPTKSLVCRRIGTGL
jgi:hypothetical protein